jgi:hypothetical protein
MGLRPTNGDESAQGPVMVSGRRGDKHLLFHLQNQMLRFAQQDSLVGGSLTEEGLLPC